MLLDRLYNPPLLRLCSEDGAKSAIIGPTPESKVDDKEQSPSHSREGKKEDNLQGKRDKCDNVQRRLWLVGCKDGCEHVGCVRHIED
jgi:hypothetical protein